MKPIICASCGEVLTLAVWDKRTEQLYCRDCIPPLPSNPPQGWPGSKTTKRSLKSNSGADLHERGSDGSAG